MKIALVRQKYTPFGGAERYMARLVDGLAAEGHEVHILAAKWDTGGETPASLHKVPVVKNPGWLKALTFSLGCRKIIRREGFDIVFSLERTLQQDIYRAGDGCHRQWLIQKNLGKGVWARCLTYLNPFQLAYLRLERKLFTDAKLKAIIANSASGKKEITRLYGVDPDKIHVVYNGIDSSTFPFAQRERFRRELAEEFAVADGELRLLYVGSGFERKGVPILIQAAARLRIPFRLFIVGKGRLATYRRLAQAAGIADRVVFTGPRQDVERFYLGSDVFVFPTRYDPFSNATLEAMACGLPVITTAWNGAAELISNGVNGFVVQDPLAADAIAVCLEKLAMPGECGRMGSEARSTASEFTMTRNVRETLQVIDAVIPT
jgi:UDP-glucose:(heptosyl)LPS alpha-1,3-glucosyltransferase